MNPITDLQLQLKRRTRLGRRKSATTLRRRLRTRMRVAAMAAAGAMLVGSFPLLALGPAGHAAAPAAASAAAVGAGFDLNAADLRFILQQIKIAEAHAAGGTIRGTGPNQVESTLLPFGLRTVDGSWNNLVTGKQNLGKSDNTFPRLLDTNFRVAEDWETDPDGPGAIQAGDSTTYASKKGLVNDSEPRVVSNLIADQTATNPAAVAAAGDGATADQSGSFFIPNTAPDEGLSAPYNSWFTLFGQFFDHGLDLVNKGQSGTVFMPLKADDPLYNPTSRTNFMVLTRATNRPGADGVLGDNPNTAADESADDVQQANNQTSPFVDQSQTYASHPAHQVFLREYDLDAAGKPVSNGKMLHGPDGTGLATWASLKTQAADKLVILLEDTDVLNVPLLATDPYGRFTRGPNGFPQMVTPTGLVEGDPAANGGLGVAVPADVARTNHAFLDDIAHHAAPRAGLAADLNTTVDQTGPSNTYDDEMLDAHFVAGDGRINENIGLTAVHHVFHSEHNRMVDYMKALITEQNIDVAEWQLEPGVWNGERIFQAARFVTEMEYQHLVFEEFGRKVQPMINVFSGYDTSVDPAIVAEFAHVVYRFGHSMLTESVDRKFSNGARGDAPLLDVFLNPPAYNSRPDGTRISDAEGAGAIVNGMTRQVGNELDEFVTEALRNDLLGLPLDLASLNMARGRETGVPRLNAARRSFFNATGDPALRPYDNWTDFGNALRHPSSLVNFVAAYGEHPTITSATTMVDKRAAADVLVNQAGTEAAPADATEFLEGTGTWATAPTGLNDVDFWMGGLAEAQTPFGGLLGSTFNFVFETQMENLQDGDRFYYLTRTAGLNLLTQLEGNSFAELIERNTTATNLPADSFSHPDYVFDMTAVGASGPVQEDTSTTWSEPALLSRMANGTTRFSGGEHVVFIGSTGNDSMMAGIGDDTLRGMDGNDKAEGGAGVDNLIGGQGDDILTDSGGDDVIKGGPDDDVISSGLGFDLNMGNAGNDFVLGGSDPTETLAGPGDDLVIAGQSFDTVFGDDGDDWIEGGGQADLLQGDNGAPFQNDVNDPGHDVIIGQGGNDDYDSEGGDDIMVAGPGIERNEGMPGFDWVTYEGDPEPADADMRFTGLLPPTLDNLRDRFDLTEALSGFNQDDILRGDDFGTADLAAENALNAAGIARITGLQGLLGTGVTSFDSGNIIVGGAGSDLLEGRGGDDRIDGDAWLDVNLVSPDPDNPGATKTVPGLASLQADLLAGRIDPGAVRVERSIKMAPAVVADSDAAVFTGARAEYTIDRSNDGLVTTVTHTGGTAVDGTDRLTNVERLIFTDQTVEVVAIPTNTPATGTVTINDATPAENQALTVANTIADADGIQAGTLRFDWQTETAPGVWVAASNNTATFTPDDPEVGQALRVVATFTDGDGFIESVTSAPTAAVTNVNDAPVGTPTLSDATPQEGVALSGDATLITDADGMVNSTFAYQWQQGAIGGAAPTANIAGATQATFTPGQGQVNRRLRLRVQFTDDHGTLQTLFTAATGVTGDLFTGTAANNTWNGTAGDDRAFGLGGNDTLNAGAGDDVVAGGAGNDTLNLGAGDDTAQVSGTGDGFDVVNGDVGVDRVQAMVANTAIGFASFTSVQEITAQDPGGNTLANVRILGSGAANSLDFSAMSLSGVDFVDTAGGADTLVGNDAANDLRGGAANDNIAGHGGNDVITGGAGNDTMQGGTPGVVLGNTTDRFVFAGANFGTDTINAFDSNPADGQDALDISSYGITAGTFATQVAISGTNTLTTVIITGGGTSRTIRLPGTARNTVSVDDFTLAP